MNEKNSINFYALLKKNPLKIIRGTKTGAEIAKATWIEGDAADKKDPNDTALFATRIHARLHKRNLSAWGFKPLRLFSDFRIFNSLFI